MKEIHELIIKKMKNIKSIKHRLTWFSDAIECYERNFSNNLKQVIILNTKYNFWLYNKWLFDVITILTYI